MPITQGLGSLLARIGNGQATNPQPIKPDAPTKNVASPPSEHSDSPPPWVFFSTKMPSPHASNSAAAIRMLPAPNHQKLQKCQEHLTKELGLIIRTLLTDGGAYLSFLSIGDKGSSVEYLAAFVRIRQNGMTIEDAKRVEEAKRVEDVKRVEGVKRVTFKMDARGVSIGDAKELVHQMKTCINKYGLNDIEVAVMDRTR